MEIVGHLIGGERVTETTKTLPLNNPATGRQEAELALASIQYVAAREKILSAG